MWKALLLHICHLSIVGLFTMIHATCDLQPITGDDAQFCSDKFHVVYQGIGDVSCKHVPPCENYTQALSDAPALRYSNAEEDEVYTLIMVDPDAPSRQNPKFKNWRHWVLADIQVTLMLMNLHRTSAWGDRWPPLSLRPRIPNKRIPCPSEKCRSPCNTRPLTSPCKAMSLCSQINVLALCRSRKDYCSWSRSNFILVYSFTADRR
ncbi:phosphatidylethanolamine-binding protein 4 isoform X1 [Phyllobates terribilis]|uniref:phosphatidylethanolamine-binding protein 4 isoform X1 n=1 Tax=Phyllobates terribilis TaxID=111132 RepID=UPI003CCADC7A